MLNRLPTYGAEMYSFVVLGHTPPPPDKRPNAGYGEVSPSFFRTLKIPLVKGRYLDEHDTQTAPWTVVINETFAHRYFPNEDPIGQQLLVRYDPWPVDEDHPRQIVGIVGDVKHWGLSRPASPHIYVSYQQQSAIFPGGAVTVHLDQYLVVRTASGLAGHQADLASVVKNVVMDLGVDQPVTDVSSMDQVLSESRGDARFFYEPIRDLRWHRSSAGSGWHLWSDVLLCERAYP